MRTDLHERCKLGITAVLGERLLWARDHPTDNVTERWIGKAWSENGISGYCFEQRWSHPRCIIGVSEREEGEGERDRQRERDPPPSASKGAALFISACTSSSTRGADRAATCALISGTSDSPVDGDGFGGGGEGLLDAGAEKNPFRSPPLDAAAGCGVDDDDFDVDDEELAVEADDFDVDDEDPDIDDVVVDVDAGDIHTTPSSSTVLDTPLDTAAAVDDDTVDDAAAAAVNDDDGLLRRRTAASALLMSSSGGGPSSSIAAITTHKRCRFAPSRRKRCRFASNWRKRCRFAPSRLCCESDANR
jgi:hypothetical protein